MFKTDFDLNFFRIRENPASDQVDVAVHKGLDHPREYPQPAGAHRAGTRQVGVESHTRGIGAGGYRNLLGQMGVESDARGPRCR